jgi:predicted phage terminase large subunit-like protein
MKLSPKATPERLAALKAKIDLYRLLESRERCENNLSEFVKAAWPFIDNTPYQPSWAIDAVCDHLEAVVLGQIPRLLINIPPRCGKTSVGSIAFPAWVWARSEVNFLSGPQVKFLCASYGHSLSLMNSNKVRRLLFSPWYQKLWPQKIVMQPDQNTKMQFDNTKGGSLVATSVGGSLLGLGGDILICDDLNKVAKNGEQLENEAERTAVASFWSEFHSTRLNDPKRSAVIVIQQRVHEQDVSGLILDSEEDFVHLMIPMRHDETRHCVTVALPQYDDDEPWQDPRAEEGELMWPERFGDDEVRKLEVALGPYLAAGRLQQSPSPKGGGIIKRDWWQPWDAAEAKLYGLEWSGAFKEFPPFELVVGSLDTSYGEKQENDYNALTVWGIWIDRNKNRRAMLMFAWNKRLPLHGKIVEAIPGEAKVNFQQRQKEAFGLVELTADTCKRYKVRRLLIENKTRGRDVANEINRLYARENWGVELVEPVGDKVSRTHSIVPLFTDNCVWAPDTKWAEMVIQQCQSFPKADHDDLHDTMTQFLNWARANELLVRADEMSASLEDEQTYRPQRESVAQQYGV